MNDFFIEVPKLSYSKSELLEYQSTIVDWQSNVHYRNIRKIDSVTEYNWVDFYPDVDLPVFSELRSQFCFPVSYGSFKIVKHSANAVLPYHIDPQRECVLMLPLTEENSGLKWVDSDKKVICEHEYKYPTIIYTKILHGVPLIEKERIFLQVDIPYKWDFVTERIESLFISK